MPSAFSDRASGIQTILEASTEPLQEQRKPTSANPPISSASESLKRPSAACQAQPAAPIDSTDAAGPQGDQGVDLQAQMLRQESGRHASVCGKPAMLIRIHRAVWHVLYKHKTIGLLVLPVMLLSAHRSTTWLHSAACRHAKKQVPYVLL